MVDLKACNALPKTNAEMLIVIDTGALCSLSPHCSDFISYGAINDMAIGGISATTTISGVGKSKWCHFSY